MSPSEGNRQNASTPGGVCPLQRHPSSLILSVDICHSFTTAHYQSFTLPGKQRIFHARMSGKRRKIAYVYIFFSHNLPAVMLCQLRAETFLSFVQRQIKMYNYVWASFACFYLFYRVLNRNFSITRYNFTTIGRCVQFFSPYLSTSILYQSLWLVFGGNVMISPATGSCALRVICASTLRSITGPVVDLQFRCIGG